MELSEQITKFNKITEVVDENGFDTKIRSYSGRFMYGAECVGMILHGSDFDEACKIFDRKDIPYRAESLGMAMIVYFPHIEYENVKSLIPKYEGE